MPEGSNNNNIILPSQTHLVERQIKSVDHANAEFGQTLNKETILVIYPGRSLLKPWITVPAGMYALVQVNGKDIDYIDSNGNHRATFPPGFHWANPFTQVSHLVTQQSIVFDTPVKGCKTADNVTVHIDMSLVFRIMGNPDLGEDPSLVRKFVYQLGPNGLESQLKDAQEEAVRGLARSVQHTDVYGLRSGYHREKVDTNGLGVVVTEIFDDLLKEKNNNKSMIPIVEEKKVPEVETLCYVTEDIKENLNKQFNPYGVQITQVAITNVRLPETFVSQMQEKTSYLSAIKEQQMTQKSDMQLLRFQEELESIKQEKLMDRMTEEQNGKTRYAEIQKEIDFIEAETRRILKQINENKNVSLTKIRADAQLEITKVDAEAQLILSEIQAKADADVAGLNAEKEAFINQIKGSIEKIESERDAKVTNILSEAEGKAAPKLQLLREFMLQMQKLDVHQGLAENEHLVLSGEVSNQNSNNLLAQVLVAQREGQVLLNHPTLLTH